MHFISFIVCLYGSRWIQISLTTFSERFLLYVKPLLFVYAIIANLQLFKLATLEIPSLMRKLCTN